MGRKRDALIGTGNLHGVQHLWGAAVAGHRNTSPRHPRPLRRRPSKIEIAVGVYVVALGIIIGFLLLELRWESSFAG